MQREIEKHLIEWKNKEEKYPLLVRGARQVGKSYVIEEFGKRHFNNTVSINFELTPNLKECFQNLDPAQIITKLQLLLNTRITNKDTLLFFDEIQECPQAILSLRYFKEKMPQQSVIGAGSLLEFAFKVNDFRMPVGRIQFLNLEPLSFVEFLHATNNCNLLEYVSQLTSQNRGELVIHKQLLELLRNYLIIGGMPAVVKEYLNSCNILECQRIQSALLETYRNDFGKYANLAQHKYLQKVFDAAPRLSGQRVKYVQIDREIKSRDLKNAMELLSLARIVRPVYASRASGLPLGAQAVPQKFKLTFLDVGLMQYVCGLGAELRMEKEIMQINSGAVAEQFVGQELKAYNDPYKDNSFYFWARDKRGSCAEVDYLFTKGKYVIPVEVKSGKGGRLKSLRAFLKEKKSPVGIRLSTDQLSFHERILSVPLYMISHIDRLLNNIL